MSFSPEQIEEKYRQKFAEEILGARLVPSDCHDEDGAMMTADQAWYFVPHPDDPVMTRARIGHPPGPIPDSARWGVEYYKSDGGSYWEPPDGDFVEIGRADTLLKAIEVAAHGALDFKIQSIGEGLYWEKEVELMPHYEQTWNDSKP